MTKIAKAKLAKLEKAGTDGKMKVGDFLSWWLDPKNGKVGVEYTDRKTGLLRKTSSFHSVTSGFNEAFRLYYGCDSEAVKKAITKAEGLKLISVRLVGKGANGKAVPGARISVYRDYGDSKGISALAEMGITFS